MKSVKPGRWLSFMDGITSIGVVLFAIFWVTQAFSMGAPILFCACGIPFIIIGIISAIYSFKNATSKKRYSAFDIVDANEEPDPLNEYFNPNNKNFSIDGKTQVPISKQQMKLNLLKVKKQLLEEEKDINEQIYRLSEEISSMEQQNIKRKY